MPADLKAKWNGDHIASFEIIMKETENTKGRTGFYDAYGGTSTNDVVLLFSLAFL